MGLTSTTNSGQSGPENIGNKGVVHSPRDNIPAWPVPTISTS